EGEPRYEIDARELSPALSGFTADTLRELRLELGADAELYLLLGADQFAKLGSWHRPDEVRRRAKIVVFARPGYAAPSADARVVAMPPMPVAGVDIRARAARGEDLSALVPPAVA